MGGIGLFHDPTTVLVARGMARVAGGVDTRLTVARLDRWEPITGPMAPELQPCYWSRLHFGSDIYRKILINTFWG